jgi:hypothetical protein
MTLLSSLSWSHVDDMRVGVELGQGLAASGRIDLRSSQEPRPAGLADKKSRAREDCPSALRFRHIQKQHELCGQMLDTVHF